MVPGTAERENETLLHPDAQRHKAHTRWAERCGMGFTKGSLPSAESWPPTILEKAGEGGRDMTVAPPTRSLSPIHTPTPVVSRAAWDHCPSKGVPGPQPCKGHPSSQKS